MRRIRGKDVFFGGESDNSKRHFILVHFSVISVCYMRSKRHSKGGRGTFKHRGCMRNLSN